MKKTETIAEFLARGGKITKVPPQAHLAKEQVKSTNPGPAVIITMGEADLFYGEQKAGRKAVKKKAKATIDLSALPEELRRKFVDGIIDVETEDD